MIPETIDVTAREPAYGAAAVRYGAERELGRTALDIMDALRTLHGMCVRDDEIDKRRYQAHQAAALKRIEAEALRLGLLKVGGAAS